jgi:hypothetical protein
LHTSQLDGGKEEEEEEEEEEAHKMSALNNSNKKKEKKPFSKQAMQMWGAGRADIDGERRARTLHMTTPMQCSPTCARKHRLGQLLMK